MHLPKVEAGRAVGREPAPGVCLAADVPDNASPLIERQARWLASRLGLTLERARLLVGLAFDNRGRA